MNGIEHGAVVWSPGWTRTRLGRVRGRPSVGPAART